MPVQTTYSDAQAIAYAGMLHGEGHTIMSAVSSEASAEIAFGLAVKFGATDGKALFPTAETDKVMGVVVHSHAYSNAAGGDLGTTGLKPGAVMNVLRKGMIWVIAQTAVAPGDRLWVRAVAGMGETLGGLEDADDSTDMIDCTAQGVWLTTASAGGLALLDVDFTNKPA